ncbi:MAG: polyprenyl synthetase family protein [Calditrichia bacterium]
MKKGLKDIFREFSGDFEKFDAHFAEIMRSDIKLVDEVAKYVVKHKGKQFRPALVLVSARAVAPATESTYATAAVVELLHTASLVHDDVLDEAELRRGIATIHKIWKNKVAILMGDYLLSKSLIAATDTGSLEIMNTVATVAKRLIQGAIFELQKSRSGDTTEDDYFRLISDKTASLISACCELGALTVGATPEQRFALRDYGEQLGLAFQIKDDLLDYEASSGILGKPALADLQDKKITLPVLCAFRSADDKEKKKITKMIKNGAAKKDLGYILDFVNRYNGLESARDKSFEIKDKAVAALAPLSETPAKQSLIDLADFVVNRSK